MKKTIYSAIFLLLLAACYTPMNNSGVATTKPWLEIPGKKTDFDGKQYDSCYRFNVRFWPQEAAGELDLKESCISACCWRSDKEEVVLDFNKNFDTQLAATGRARKYSPGKITLKVTHANWINTSKVTVSPKSAITTSGLIKLSYKEYENPTRIAELNEQARQAKVAQAAALTRAASSTTTAKTSSAKPTASSAAIVHTVSSGNELAKLILQQKAGNKIDNYFYHMDKTYKKQGAVFMVSERYFTVQKDGSITCNAKARTGLDTAHLKASTFSCGTWWVDTSAQTVTPLDKRAKLIWGE